MRRVVLVLVLVLVALVGCHRKKHEPRAHGSPSKSLATSQNEASSSQLKGAPALKFEPAREAGGVRYLTLYLGGAHDGERLPTIVGFHGRGDKPENYATYFVDLHARARVVVPYGLRHLDDGSFEWFENDRSVDRKPEVFDPGLSEALPQIAALLIELSKQVAIAGKPIVTGFSQGAIVTHAIVARHPELVALAAPVAGFLPPIAAPDKAEAGAILPRIVAFHGDADPKVSHTWDQASVAKEKAAGFPAEIRLFPGIAHTFGPEELADYSDLLDVTLRELEKQ